ncbi:hypothetical protein [Microtetraspora niveoalba]|uniref:hypothetical protein n=1 Tax=Microtetraspora niveoalba TaxID=46175 RepID=UPI00082D9E63|nr:hypothetical protein [Microtetraspora niveoalba]
MSDAEIAETRYTAFASKKGQAVAARLIARRVKRLNPKAASGQDELFSVYRYHAVFSDSPFHLAQAEEQHRDHAIVEQVFADLGCGPLAHLPSGDFAANAAWLTCAAITHNLLRATGCLAGPVHAKARVPHSAAGWSLSPPAWPGTDVVTSPSTYRSIGAGSRRG